MISGLGIVAALRSSRAPTRCTVDGMAASMAAVVLEACSIREAKSYSVILFHEARVMPSGPMRRADLQEQADTLGALNHAMALIVAPRLHMDVAVFAARIAAGDWAMAADQALAARAIDTVLP
jgi:ATP-dependent protease ClpP protease subunit